MSEPFFFFVLLGWRQNNKLLCSNLLLNFVQHVSKRTDNGLIFFFHHNVQRFSLLAEVSHSKSAVLNIAVIT